MTDYLKRRAKHFSAHELNLFSKIKKTFVRPDPLQYAEIYSYEVGRVLHLAFFSGLLYPTFTSNIMLVAFGDTVLT